MSQRVVNQAPGGGRAARSARVVPVAAALLRAGQGPVRRNRIRSEIRHAGCGRATHQPCANPSTALVLPDQIRIAVEIDIEDGSNLPVGFLNATRAQKDGTCRRCPVHQPGRQPPATACCQMRSGLASPLTSPAPTIFQSVSATFEGESNVAETDRRCSCTTRPASPDHVARSGRPCRRRSCRQRPRPSTVAPGPDWDSDKAPIGDLAIHEPGAEPAIVTVCQMISGFPSPLRSPVPATLQAVETRLD